MIILIYIKDYAIKNNYGCLVYCKNGLNKSVAVVVAYLIRHSDYNLIQSIKKIRNVRSNIDIDKALMYSLYQYEILIKGYSSLNSNIDVNIEDMDESNDLDEEKFEDKVMICLRMNNLMDLNHLLQDNNTNRHQIIVRRCLFTFTKEKVNEILEMYPDIKTPNFIKLYKFAIQTSLSISEHLLDELGCKNALRQGMHSVLTNSSLFYEECNDYFHLLLTTKKNSQELDTSLSSIHQVMKYFFKIVKFDYRFYEQFINLLIKRIVKNQFDITKENQLLQALSMFNDLCERANNIISSHSLFNDILQEYKRNNDQKSLSLSTIRTIPLVEASKSIYNNCIDSNNEFLPPILPDKLANEWYSFKEYVDLNYQRKLYILPQFGDCEMNVNINGKRYTIIVNTAMMCILCLFNDVDDEIGLTFNDIKSKLNINEKIIKPALNSILKGSYIGSGTRKALLILKSSNENSESVYLLNSEFSSNSKRFKIPMSKD